LRAAIREHSPHPIAILTAKEAYGDLAPGLPLIEPGFEVPAEWQPAPEYTAEDQAVYDAALAEMAEVLPDEELLRFVETFGATLHLHDHGALRARDAQQVPAPVRQIVRDRQAALVAALAAQE
jgi:hypothetical protein